MRGRGRSARGPPPRPSRPSAGTPSDARPGREPRRTRRTARGPRHRPVRPRDSPRWSRREDRRACPKGCLIRRTMSDMDDAGRVSRRALLAGGLGVIVAGAGAGAAVEWDSPTFVRLRGGCGPNPAVPPSRYVVESATSFTATIDVPGGTKSTQSSYSVALPPGYRKGDGTPLAIYLPGLNGGDNDLDRVLGIAGFATAAGSKLAFLQPGFGGTTYWHRRADGRDPVATLMEDVVPAVEKRFGVGGSRERRGVFGSSMG